MATMLTLPQREPGAWRDGDVSDLGELVEAIGGNGFARQLLAFVDRAIGADHCSLFRLRGFELTEIASASLEGAADMAAADLTRYDLKRRLSQVRPGPARFDFEALAAIQTVRGSERPTGRRERLLIAGGRGETTFAIRVLRSALRPPAGDAARERLAHLSDLLVSMVAKQDGLTASEPNVCSALTSLAEIERSLLAASELSRREGEVCARILFGLSSCGIALDLAIGKESVMTYRKRAYQRLGLGSQRELLIWYLALWAKLRAQGPDAMASTTLN